MNHLSKTIFAACAVAGAVLCARAGQDLPINGDFYGLPSRTHIAPGWQSSPGGVRFYPGRKPGKQILELIAPPNAAKIAVTDLHQVSAGVLEIEADVSGRGVVSLGFEAYDGSRSRMVASGRQSWQLTDIPAKIKFNFPLHDPSVAFVRITLTAEPGTIARFADVEAEMKYGQAPMPPLPPPPPPVPRPVPAPAPAPQTLMHDGFYTLESLPPVSVFRADVPAGRDIDFKLGEHPSRNQYWNLAGGYDPRICRIEMEHKHKHGRSYAKIELKGMYRGKTRVEFVNAAGKRVIVHFTSL